MSNYDVIIVNYNGEKIIGDCLSSILDSSHKPKSIIVFDNNSRDNSLQIIQNKFPEVILIESKENIGFGRGNNAGLKKATAKYVFFLNNDLKIDRFCAEHLCNYLDSEANCALVNPLILKGWEKDSTEVYSCGAEMNTAGFGYSKLIKKSDRSLTCFSGAAVMARREIIQDLEFEKHYFLYYEEPELSVRILKRGHEIASVSGATCYHLESYSSPQKAAAGIGFRQFYGIQNRWYMLGKHWPLRLVPTALFFNCLHLLFFLSFFIKHRQFSHLKLLWLAPINWISGLATRDMSISNTGWYQNLSSSSPRALQVQKNQVLKD